MNIVVSNVRGPDLPMYLAVARMVAFAPVSIAMNGLGLNVTVFNYAGTLWVCAVACRDMMPDPGFFADCLRGAFAELVAAADALPAAPEPPGPARSASPAQQRQAGKAPRRRAKRGGAAAARGTRKSSA